jgi:hypothetical protein
VAPPFVVVRADYTLSLERHEGNLWGHAEVRRWTPAIARALRRDVDALITEHGPILATPTPDRASGAAYDKFRRFMAFIGFQFHMTKTIDGVRRSIYARWR